MKQNQTCNSIKFHHSNVIDISSYFNTITTYKIWPLRYVPCISQFLKMMMPLFFFISSLSLLLSLSSWWHEQIFLNFCWLSTLQSRPTCVNITITWGLAYRDNFPISTFHCQIIFLWDIRDVRQNAQTMSSYYSLMPKGLVPTITFISTFIKWFTFGSENYLDYPKWIRVNLGNAHMAHYVSWLCLE